MASLAGASPTISTINIPRLPGSPKSLKFTNVIPVVTFRPVRVKHSPIYCTKLTPWEPSPAKHAPVEDGGYDFLQKTTNIFETLGSENTAEAPLASAKTEEVTAPLEELQFLKWRTGLLGPSLLLSTGMVPTLWLPISSIFLGPNIASLLSLIGLDCIFNVGATPFLLMADSCARPKKIDTELQQQASF